MAQDIISDALNNIMNIKRLEKKEVKIKRVSKVLIKLLEMMKADGYIDFEVIDGVKKEIVVQILKLNECRAIKPRYSVGVAELDKYMRRFLPSRNFGNLVISSNAGLIKQKDVYEKNIGGCLLAYYY